MKIIDELNNFIDNLKIEYPEFNKIKTSVGLTPSLADLKNMNDLPLILIENIKYDHNSENVIQNIGSLNFSLMYINQVTYDNGYEVLEDEFVTKFNSYIHNSCNNTTINSIEYDTDNDNRYLVAYSLSSNIELS